jgi:peptidoglycan/LPS O-acetylase OafA/YrhL
MAYFVFTAPIIKRYRAYFLPAALAIGLLTACTTSSFSTLALHATSSVLVLLAAVGADARKPISSEAFLVKLGDASYGLYLVHITIINVCLARGPFEQTLLGIPALLAIAIGLGLVFGAIEQALYGRVKALAFGLISVVDNKPKSPALQPIAEGKAAAGDVTG